MKVSPPDTSIRVAHGRLSLEEAVILAGDNQPLEKMVWKLRKEANKALQEHEELEPEHVAGILNLEAEKYEAGVTPQPGGIR